MPLRKIEENDLELVLKWRNSSVIRNSMFNQDIIVLEDHIAWFSKESKKDSSCWLLYLNSEGQPSGVVYCTDIDKKHNHAFWGFYAAPDAEPGTGTIMCTEALEYFFKVKKLNKINAEVIESNQRSHNFHRKMGFKLEGLFSEHYKTESGYESVTRYAILLSSWLK